MKVFKCITMIMLGLFMVAAGCLIWGVDMFFAPHPPQSSLAEVVVKAKIRKPKPGLRKIEDCYTFQREGLTACFLSGAPEVQGAVLGRFFSETGQILEQAAHERLNRILPNSLLRWLAIRYLTIRQSESIGDLSPGIQKEIFGYIQTTENLYPWYGSFYNRVLQSQTFYDLLHSLEEEATTSSLAIGLLAERVDQETPLLAYNLDISHGIIWDQNKLVLLVKPAQGLSFLAVSWPGSFGVLSGMNEAGLGIALLTAHTQHPLASGVPVMLLAREVLEQAKTLKEAVEILQAAKSMVAESFLIGSGPENNFVVVEKTPDKTIVRKMQKQYIVVGNHFVSPELRNDPINLEVRNSGPSLTRLSRAKELLRRHSSPLPITRVAGVLRDRRGEFGVRLGLGHPAAINTLNSVHSVIFDLENQKAWISRSPHQLGRFVPFSLSDFTVYDKKEVIAEEPLLLSGKYNEYLVYQHGRQEAQRLFQEGKHQESLSWLQEVNHLNPLDYRSFFLAGKALHALSRRDEAAYNYRQALRLYPAYRHEKREIEVRLKELDLLEYKQK